MKKTSKSFRRPSITMLLLDHLACREDGMSFTEMQRFAFSLRLNGYSHPDRPMPRGWWCTQLLGSLYSHVGILSTYAFKGSDGRWHRNSVSHGGKPYANVERTPGYYRANCGHKY